MHSKITARIQAETGIANLFSVLAEELAPGDLQSLLLAIYQQRVRRLRLAEAVPPDPRNALALPSDTDARVLNRFDGIAFEAAREFEAVELSPVCPLGATALLGSIDQNSVLTTIRNVEVPGDSTPALALECARRRQDPSQRAAQTPVRLCSSQRVVRLQPFDVPGFTPHFRLFSLVSAGRDRGSHAFEIQHLGEHIRFYLELFRRLNSEGFHLTEPLIEISDLNITEALLASAGIARAEVAKTVRAHRPGSSQRFLEEHGISLPADVELSGAAWQTLVEEHHLEVRSSHLQRFQERVFAPLEEAYPEGTFRINLSRLEGLGYYSGICRRVSPRAPDGTRHAIADGGFTDWTARLLSDRKERLLTSGIGSEFVCRRYRAA